MCSAVCCSALETSALEVVVLRFYGFTPVQVQSLSAFTAVYIASKLIHLTLNIGTLPSCEVLLHQIESLPVNDGFVGIFKDQYVLWCIVQPFLSLLDLE